MTPGGIRVQVAADEPKLVDAPFELADGVGERVAGSLGQLTDAHEVRGVQPADAMDEVVAVLRPMQARRRVTNMVRHGRGSRREDRDIAAALPLELQLGLLEALANLVVRDRERRFGPCPRRIAQCFDLRVAKLLQAFRRRGVVTVAIDDHEFIAFSIRSSRAMVGTQLAALDSGCRLSRMALTNSTS